MSKRRYKITGIDGVVAIFNLDEVFDQFKDSPLKDTEVSFTLQEEVDTLLDMKEREIIHFFEDRAKELPCLVKRIA